MENARASDFAEELALLRTELTRKDEEISRLKTLISSKLGEPVSDISEVLLDQAGGDFVGSVVHYVLNNEDIGRYSRQLILPEIGVRGQLKLKSSSVLIVGAGGLGCPAAIYLTAAGIGKLGLVDFDEVEINNLHRQVLHTEDRLGVSKVISAAQSCKRLNSSVVFVPYRLQLNSQNALQIIKHYDVVLDATDNVATRYLLNDACVLTKKPLVSGSALRFEGQLTVYNYQGGPCYRCLYPKPPPPETVTNCSDGGVLGVVPGIIGCLEALEAIKIVANIGTTYFQRLLLFDALDLSFRTIKLRPHQPTCLVCGDKPTITELIDYEQFCGARATDKDRSKNILTSDERISVKRYKEMLERNIPHLLIDVRTPVEMEICQLPHTAINIPMDSVGKEESVNRIKEEIKSQMTEDSLPVILVCRRGNDSQTAVRTLQEKLKDSNITVKDIQGGLTAWAKQVDNNFPVY
ncbi:adenylyltransferase and sulfurtransferase MOCS3-like [Gigantopelta aegis]|uniref:adenylyltransferase and sulfurtransferase MOCS3-like n=1 Tax=Gigantopelta aegis TaxID=1735272 RepID=UPI001B888380|nr:adenylyltransferase and sulfurtransferase MOCS3-like [Gigantopelta aegis]